MPGVHGQFAGGCIKCQWKMSGWPCRMGEIAVITIPPPTHLHPCPSLPSTVVPSLPLQPSLMIRHRHVRSVVKAVSSEHQSALADERPGENAWLRLPTPAMPPASQHRQLRGFVFLSVFRCPSKRSRSSSWFFSSACSFSSAAACARAATAPAAAARASSSSA